MKNIKDRLYEWKKHKLIGFLSDLFFAAPVMVLFLPRGYQGDYDSYKWYIYMFIVISTISVNVFHHRFENHESTIEKLNDEIENLKNEINQMKSKEHE